MNQEPLRRMVWRIYQLVTWLVGIALFIGVMYLIFRLRIFPALIVSFVIFWLGKKGSKIQPLQLTDENLAIQALCIPLRRLGATAIIICITLMIAIKLLMYFYS